MKNLWKALGAMLIAGLAVGALIVNGAGAAGYGSSKPKLSITVKKQSKSKVLKKGLKVKVSVNKSAKVTLTAKKGSKTLGSASKTLKKGNIKVKLNKAGKSAVENSEGTFKFTVKGKAKAGGKSDTDSATAKLK